MGLKKSLQLEAKTQIWPQQQRRREASYIKCW